MGASGNFLKSTSRARVVGVLLLLGGCRNEVPPLLRLAETPTAAGVRLTLLPAPGARINARLKPALERRDSSILHFESGSLTPDSSYFTAPPVLDTTLPVDGVIRASVCPAGRAVCVPVTLAVHSGW
jgi:hypothetical protein